MTQQSKKSSTDELTIHVKSPNVETMERNAPTVRRSTPSSVVSSPELHSKLSGLESCLSLGVKAICCPFFPCYMTVVRDYERVVVLRFGKLFSAQAGAGGLYVIWPGIDTARRVDIRERIINVPRQAIVTDDGLTIEVDGVVFFKVNDALSTVFGVTDYVEAVSTLAQTKLREVLGTKDFGEVQSERSSIEKDLREAMQRPTDKWGISVTRVELTDVKLPSHIQRAMGQEAESHRNAKAKVIEAMGEQEAAHVLKQAADIMSQNGAAMSLRFLQTISEVATEQGSTIVLPFPTEFLNSSVLMGQATEVPPVLQDQD